MIKISEGQVFGRLVVIKRMPNNNHNKPVWHCYCECGNTKDIVAQSLTSGKTISCGCYQKERVKQTLTKHGKTGWPEFDVWYRIKQRCYNKNHHAYKYYGGSGIKMSEDWFNSFECFLNDIGRKPSKRHSIERVDVTGDYCKENCIWTDNMGLQSFNKRKQSNNKSGKTGVFYYKRLSKWEAYIWFEGSKISLGLFETFEEAVDERLKAEIKYYGFNRRDND